MSAYRYIKGLLLLFVTTVALIGCNVHEWPELPEKEPLVVRLVFDTDLPQWEQQIDSRSASLPETKGLRDYGTMRYIVRAYPLYNGSLISQQPAAEFVFMRDVADGYDNSFTLDIAPGEYKLMVWADLSDIANPPLYYNAADFAEITLQGEHRPNTDYRDAFRGMCNIELTTSIDAHETPVVEIAMQRPLAKFEFVTNDLIEFFEKESTRLSNRSTSAEQAQAALNLSDYRLEFRYIGFMPVAYSMFTDKPVDSKTGVSFGSHLTQFNDNEASLGFDYVFVNGSETAVTVQIALYNASGELLSLTEPIDVPLRRGRHTVVRGSFLLTQATGGVGIDPGYFGDHNVFLP